MPKKSNKHTSISYIDIVTISKVELTFNTHIGFDIGYDIALR
jgi:hypothetical protein